MGKGRRCGGQGTLGKPKSLWTFGAQGVCVSEWPCLCVSVCMCLGICVCLCNCVCAHTHVGACEAEGLNSPCGQGAGFVVTCRELPSSLQGPPHTGHPDFCFQDRRRNTCHPPPGRIRSWRNCRRYCSPSAFPVVLPGGSQVIFSGTAGSCLPSLTSGHCAVTSGKTP